MNSSPEGIRPIAVIGGTGPAGMGLALRWARAGETVILGSRDEKRAQHAAAALASGVLVRDVLVRIVGEHHCRHQAQHRDGDRQQ